jgi:predicted nucleic acid-binding protein
MMMEIIVDTSALIAFFVKAEKHHLIAQEFVQAHPHTQ